MKDIIKHSYNGAIVSQEPDGYVSLTDMAKASGKKVNDYLRLGSSKAYIEGLSGSTGIPADKLIRVNESSGRNENRGTWAHPEIAIDFAQWCNVPFRIWANRVLRGVISQPAPEPKKAIAYYSDRCADIRKNLVKPKGQWCVIEKCNHLLLEVEKAGYPIDKMDLLDGSIGKRWANYRRELGYSEPNQSAHYQLPHCPHPVSVACYPSSELGIFSDWLESIYEEQHLNKYLQGKYGKLVKV
jgi:hypothetical protein